MENTNSQVVIGAVTRRFPDGDIRGNSWALRTKMTSRYSAEIRDADGKLLDGMRVEHQMNMDEEDEEYMDEGDNDNDDDDDDGSDGKDDEGDEEEGDGDEVGKGEGLPGSQQHVAPGETRTTLEDTSTTLAQPSTTHETDGSGAVPMDD